MKFAADLSNYSGPPDRDRLRAIVYSERLERLIIAANYLDTLQGWIDAAHGLPVQLDAYVYLTAGEDVPAQIQRAVSNVENERNAAEIDTLWLDYEDPTVMRQLHRATLDQHLAIPRRSGLFRETGCYTSPYFWQQVGYNIPAGDTCPLWVARWSETIDFNVEFGGWLRASMVQFRANYTSYDILMDLSAYE